MTPGKRRPRKQLWQVWIPSCAGMTIFYVTINDDGFVKSRRNPHCVILAKAGIQVFNQFWTPAPVPDLIRGSPG